MLKKYKGIDALSGQKLNVGDNIYVVTKKGVILEGFLVESILMDMISLNRSPLDEGTKQGFVLNGEWLLPNWCEGKRAVAVACTSREQAELISEKVKRKETLPWE